MDVIVVLIVVVLMVLKTYCSEFYDKLFVFCADNFFPEKTTEV